MLYLSQISSLIDISYLSYPGYKLDHFFVPEAGVYVYVSENICSRHLSSFEGKNLAILWLRVHKDDQRKRQNWSTYRPRSNGYRFRVATSTEIVILGDIKAHHADWLYLRTTNHVEWSVYDFVYINSRCIRLYTFIVGPSADLTSRRITRLSSKIRLVRQITV